MGNRRSDDWEANYEAYSESQVEAVLDECGVEVESETTTHFLCLCPFHGNHNSPALAVDKELGKWICFNPSCSQSGDLEDLPRRLLKLNVFQCKRLILKNRNAANKPLAQRLEEIKKKVEFPTFSLDVVERMHQDFWNSPAHAYMRGRGFSDDTLNFFKVGYSAKKNQVAVPMYDTPDHCVGVIGRSIVGKEFENSKKLPRRFLPWNIINAKKHGDTVIICESSFDAMRIHQAGYGNVVALLGGIMTPWQQEYLNRTFSKIIIMTDFDQKRYQPNCKKCKKQGYGLCNGHRDGRDAGRHIADKLANKKIMWAAYDDTCVYPHDAKDASDMTDEEIRQCLKNAISMFQYSRWNIEE